MSRTTPFWLSTSVLIKTVREGRELLSRGIVVLGTTMTHDTCLSRFSLARHASKSKISRTTQTSYSVGGTKVVGHK